MAGRKKKAKPTTKKRKEKKSALLSLKQNIQKRLPVVKFLVAFLISILAFYWLYNSAFFAEEISKPLTKFQAELSSHILNFFGQNTWVEKSILHGQNSALDIKKGCDGIEPTALFIIGVLIVPLSWKTKLPGLLMGLIALLLINLLRITGLYFANVYWPEAFEFLHLHGGFALFFVVAIIVWMVWASWAIQYTKVKKAAS
ncbi:MAG: archaeosortase/exosortase family protein [Lewinellaceae bacterium]|nr:archaeosortase/exosortase family protein [Phaeodactylibacter sp.]MCB9037373.1 archaeosortase/exosortase family protein [Lewinellaceae bacterium]